MAVIRDAKPADLQAIKNILTLNGQIDDITSEDINNFVVVEVDRNIVGCGVLRDHGSSVEIAKVSVLPNQQGKGYGMEIVLSLMGRVRGRPCWLLSVHSHSFWELFDFHIIPDDDAPDFMKKQCRRCERSTACNRVIMFKKGI